MIKLLDYLKFATINRVLFTTHFIYNGFLKGCLTRVSIDCDFITVHNLDYLVFRDNNSSKLFNSGNNLWSVSICALTQS